MIARSALPDYDPLQQAFQEAFDPELTEVVNDLEIAADARVLDVPCGDGFYSRRLARRMNGEGGVVGIDHNKAVLRRARKRSNGKNVTFHQGDAYALSYADNAFDHALCAMSFISIADPVRALREVFRVLTPDGGIAVLETDELHHILLTWPIEVELAIQRVILDRCGGRYSPARRVNRMLREAGFSTPRRKTFAADRAAPFATSVMTFLTRYLAFLRDLARPHLSRSELLQFDRYADPGNAKSLFQRADAELTCLMTLHQARRRN